MKSTQPIKASHFLVTELVKQFEITKKNLEKAQSALNSTETELKDLKKVRFSHKVISIFIMPLHQSNDQLQNEFHRKQDELTKIEVVAKVFVVAYDYNGHCILVNSKPWKHKKELKRCLKS